MNLYQILSILISIVIFTIPVIFVRKEKTLNILLKITTGIIFVVVTLKLFSRFALNDDYTYYKDVFSTQTINIIKGRYEGIFESKKDALFIVIFRWLSYIAIGTAFTGCLVDGKGIRIYNLFLLPIIIVLNTIFFDKTIFSLCGEYEEFKTLQEILLMTRIISFSLAFSLFLKRELILKDKKRIGINSILRALYILPMLLIFFMPIYGLENLFGEIGSYSKDYNKYHVLMLIITALMYFIPVIVLRNKDIEDKKTFLIIYAFASFFEYFSRYCAFGMPLEDYPLHICNTAVIFMLIAVIFNNKSVFYFTYFCNTLGALFALLLPNNGDFISSDILEFWYNHVIDFTLPFIAVSIGAFNKPKFKNMLGAIGVFTFYIIMAQLAGAYINYDIDPLANTTHVDFFFLYGDKFTDVKLIQKLAWNLKFSVNQSGNLKYIIYFNLFGRRVYAFYLYSILIYIFFIGFSFVLWYAIDKIERTVQDVKLTIYKTNLKKEKIGKISRKEIKNINKEMEGKTMIKITNFSKKYGSNKNYSVKDFNLTIEDGDVFGFIGHNGAGKSTVIKSLVGIQSITEGSIEISGFDIEKYPLQAKLNIGYVSDNHAVYEKLTGREYINYVAELYQVPKNEREERIEHYTKMFGLTDALDKEAKGYSHGMKQKLVVIASLIHEPKVWVLDEPLTGLDPTSSYQIKECMREHAEKGNIVFFSTHVIEVIEKLCTKIAIISHGTLMGVYKIADLKKQGISLESLYLKYVVSDENRGNFKEDDIKTTDSGMILERKEEKENAKE